MYIIIVGGGNIGYYLARTLLREKHEVLVMEKKAERCQQIEEELGEVCLRGDGCEITTLEAAGAARADMLIAVTNEDEDNLVACQVAKFRFNVRRTIARVGNPQYEELFQKLGVDITVSSTRLILENIEEEVPTHPLVHVLQIEDKELELVEVKILPQARAIGKRVAELPLPQGTLLTLTIRRGQQPFIPNLETRIQAEDRLLALVPPEEEEKLKLALLGELSS